MMIKPKPSVGRVVWYFERGAAQLEDGSDPWAAIVAGVNSDEDVNLAYFNQHGNHGNALNVPLVQAGDPAPAGAFCTWMPYQVGQAANEYPKGPCS